MSTTGQTGHLLLQGAVVVPCDGTPPRRADVRVRGGRIVELGPDLDAGDALVEDLSGHWLTPGFVQSHVHLVQTLFRGLADDLPLLDWLRRRIWPLEAAHDPESTYWSARLGVSELLRGGTTAILDMASVRHTDAVFQACAEAGIRASIGRAMMDRPNEAGLSEPTERSLAGAADEADRWHGRGRLRYAFAPRFVPSCTDGLLAEVAQEARRRGCRIHTHASENREEVALVRRLTGRDNVQHLHTLGCTGEDVVLAHCIHLAESELALLAETGTRVAHCPSSNLKLGSGIAPIPEMLRRGVHVSLGADGAPCNNRLDAFTEMRLAALIQKPLEGPTAMPAATVLEMATRRGAEAVGWEDVGMVRPGARADLVAHRPDALHVVPTEDPVSALVYAAGPGEVRHVWIDGEPVVRDGEVLAWNHRETVEGARRALRRLVERAAP